MLAGTITSFAEFKRIVGEAQSAKKHASLIGLLFMREGQEITDKSIIPSLGYFDLRSGSDLHFILPGWRSEYTWNFDEDYKLKKWTFSEQDFITACAVISAETKWKYSGGTDLLLITTRKTAVDEIIIDFSGAINIHLHAMDDKSLIESPEVLFERLIRFAASYRGADPLMGLSFQEARVSLAHAIIDAVLELLPKAVKKRLDYAKEFVIQDVSMPNSSSSALISIHEEES